MLKWSLTIARVFGIPIKLHLTLLLLFPILILYPYGWIIAVGLFTSIVLHELGHALVAIHKGCRVREILLLPIGGAAQMERLPLRARDEILVASAGPLTSLALFFLLHYGGPWVPFPAIAGGLEIFGQVNLALAVFNLTPAFPMDGGRIFRALLIPHFGRLKATFVAARLGQFIAIAAAFAVLYALWRHDDYSLISLLIVAIFIFWAAGAEYNQVVVEEKMKRRGFPFFFGPAQPLEAEEPGSNEVEISPPPYSKGPAEKTTIAPIRPQDRFFDQREK